MAGGEERGGCWRGAPPLASAASSLLPASSLHRAQNLDRYSQITTTKTTNITEQLQKEERGHVNANKRKKAHRLIRVVDAAASSGMGSRDCSTIHWE